jgi:hypothetical protein
VGFVALFNLTFAILPYSRTSSSTVVQFATQLQQVWARDAVVYYAEFDGVDLYSRYFNPATSWRPLDRRDLTGAKAEIEATQRSGREVWLDGTAVAFLAKADAGWFAAHTDRAQWMELRDRTHDLRFVRLTAARAGRSGL